jgi:hypothetical protein
MATMAQAWSGELEPELDGQMLPGRPADPEMRESASIWVFEENGEFAFPRIGIEAVGDVWDRHRYDCNFAFSDGRVMRQSTRGATLPTEGAGGQSTVLGAGGLRFECLEPFRRWHVSFEDTVYYGHVEDQIRGRFKVFADTVVDQALRRKPVRFDVELTMAAPGWTQDLRPERLAGLSEAETTDAGLMGFGWRVEQAFRGEGTFTVDGAVRRFKAVGNRVHRQSVRPMGAFRGHCWQAAVFPDGRAFGYCAYPPREDGSTYNDGYIFQDGRMYRARATKVPFLRRIMPHGDDVSFELESELGITRIEGVTTLATFHMGNPGTRGMNNNQGGARYSWDGQTTYGMIERSSPMELCTVVL